MHVYGDQGLELGPLYSGQVGGGLGDQLVKLLTKQLLRSCHDLPEKAPRYSTFLAGNHLAGNNHFST